ncbi:hypothetical protein HanXRQr2_Chr16g0772141 [Helianthus annuus]|uniref:Uncharacterized protein n=1 Tax=Helianthus annuus TaxID=4232 RepID=A0A9K3DUT0_HELAN|nr:hypothetical protein HanXRQr2_Chr16g0772141 [Helianthus annuus]KAJ0823123.1 hypothetical protein HanPSC8_Chr16g0740201 [Helianthus annuus]
MDDVRVDNCSRRHVPDVILVVKKQASRVTLLRHDKCDKRTVVFSVNGFLHINHFFIQNHLELVITNTITEHHNFVRFHSVEFSVCVDQVQTHAPKINNLLFAVLLREHTRDITRCSRVHRANNGCNRWGLGVRCSWVIHIGSNKHIAIITAETRKPLNKLHIATI